MTVVIDPHSTISPSQSGVGHTTELTLELRPPSAEVFELWEQLESECGGARLMASSTWTRLWWQHYRQQINTQVCIARRGLKVVGICLLTQGVPASYGPLRLRKLHLGTAGETEADSVCVEYNDVLARPEEKSAFLAALSQLIQKRADWDTCWGDGLLPEMAQGLQLGAPSATRTELCWYTDLEKVRERMDNPASLFSESPRTNIRRALRDFQPLELQWAEEPEQALLFYQELVDHHQARWTAAGKPGAFASRMFHDFHAELIQQLVPRQQATVTRLRNGPYTMGLLYLLVDQGHVLYYQSGTVPQTKSKYSLGMVTQYLSLVEAARRGFRTFEFMAGDKQHKRILSTDHRELIWNTWSRDSWKTRLVETLRHYKHKWSPTVATPPEPPRNSQ